MSVSDFFINDNIDQSPYFKGHRLALYRYAASKWARETPAAADLNQSGALERHLRRRVLPLWLEIPPGPLPEAQRLRLNGLAAGLRGSGRFTQEMIDDLCGQLDAALSEIPTEYDLSDFRTAWRDAGLPSTCTRQSLEPCRAERLTRRAIRLRLTLDTPAGVAEVMDRCAWEWLYLPFDMEPDLDPRLARVFSPCEWLDKPSAHARAISEAWSFYEDGGLFRGAALRFKHGRWDEHADARPRSAVWVSGVLLARALLDAASAA